MIICKVCGRCRKHKDKQKMVAGELILQWINKTHAKISKMQDIK